MAIVTVKKDRYTAESLYQWDKNQVLEIRGLSLTTVPEIHYTNVNMERALVRQSKMDETGVITADIPNSLLQSAGTLNAYVCVYEGATFKSLYKIAITVKARSKPSDYTIEGDDEIYSFNELENKFNNAMSLLDEATAKYNEAVELYEDSDTLLKECQTIQESYETWKDTVDASLEITRGTLAVGETSVVIYDDRIKEGVSAFDVYTSDFGVNPVEYFVGDGVIILFFTRQNYDIEVGVRVHE